MNLKTLLIALLAISLNSYSQISVGPKHTGTSSSFYNGEFEKFKNTETIFVLSNIYEKETYEKLLNDSWNVTPYRIVNFQEFKIDEYLNDNFSFALIDGHRKVKSSGEFNQYKTVLLYTYIDFVMYDGKKITEELNKIPKQKRIKKKDKILNNNKIHIARIALFASDKLKKSASNINKKKKSLLWQFNSKNVFLNYSPGLLKNYFQKVNNLIKNEKEFWMYKKDYITELGNLSKSKLYIPKYIEKYYRRSSLDKKAKINELLKKYKYEYEVIDDDSLSTNIIAGEKFYYLRFAVNNAERFLQVIDSKTGEIIYRDYISGMSAQLKAKYFKALSSKIKKSSQTK